MSITLSNTEEVVERSVYNAIMDVCVELGYCPDVRNSSLFPDTSQGWQAYITYQQSTINMKGFCVEVFGSSNPDDKGIKKLPRIVIDTITMDRGDFGLDASPVYEKQVDGTYNKLRFPTTSSNATFNIYAVAKDIKQMRVLLSILAIALQNFTYIKRYPTTDQKLLVKTVSSSNNPEYAQGILEHIIRYEIPDVFETAIQVIETGIPEVVALTMDTQYVENLNP